jgi:hypothetical protein
LLRRAQSDEDPEDGPALRLRPQRSADIAEGPVLVPEDVTERAREQAVQVARLSGKQIGQGGQIQVVFLLRSSSFAKASEDKSSFGGHVDRVQRGTPFRARLRYASARQAGSYIGLFLLQ